MCFRLRGVAAIPAAPHSRRTACRLDARAGKPSLAKTFDAIVSRVDALTASAEHSPEGREAIDRLQARIDVETDEFVQEVGELLVQGNNIQVARLAGVLMQRHWELLETEEQPPPVANRRWRGRSTRPCSRGDPLVA